MRPKEILDASSITQTSEKSTCQSRPGCLNRCLISRVTKISPALLGPMRFWISDFGFSISGLLVLGLLLLTSPCPPDRQVGGKSIKNRKSKILKCAAASDKLYYFEPVSLLDGC